MASAATRYPPNRVGTTEGGHPSPLGSGGPPVIAGLSRRPGFGDARRPEPGWRRLPAPSSPTVAPTGHVPAARHSGSAMPPVCSSRARTPVIHHRDRSHSAKQPWPNCAPAGPRWLASGRHRAACAPPRPGSGSECHRTIPHRLRRGHPAHRHRSAAAPPIAPVWRFVRPTRAPSVPVRPPTPHPGSRCRRWHRSAVPQGFPPGHRPPGHWRA